MGSLDRSYDVVVFGATGFTGKRVVEYLTKRASQLKVALAGRNATKLQQVLDQYGQGKGSILPNVDVFNSQSMESMAASGKLLLNCVGPYRLYGEAVVKACIQAGCDYLDVCGEPEFMESMQLKYGSLAKEKGVLVVSAVGFDCIPAEVGAHYCTQAMVSKGFVPHSIRSYLHLTYGPEGSVGHFATYESAVYGFNSLPNLKHLRKEAASKNLNPAPQVPGPRPPKLSNAPTWVPQYRGYALPFPGADASVVRRTMSARGVMQQPTAHYLAMVVVKSWYNLFKFLLLGTLCGLLAKYSLGVWVLLRLPYFFTLGFFSHEGPTEAQMRGAGFNMMFEAYGIRGEGSQLERAVTMQVKGPEPGYVATPIVLVEAALEVLEARESILKAVGGGGVLPPGFALLSHGDHYIQRIKAAGIAVGEAEIK